MERVIRSLMGDNLPPRFKFKDTYASIEMPTAYTQHLPTQQEIEDKFSELETQEEAVEAVAAEATVISKFDSVITSNLEVGTANLFVDTTSGNIGIGTNKPVAQLSLGAWASGSAGTGVDTQLLLSGPHNSGTNVGSTFKLKIEGYDNNGSTIYPIYCKDEQSNVDFYIKNRPSASGIPTMFFAGDVTVNGGITQTQYRPGEIIETLQGRANGRSISVLSGTYTLQNVTGIQEATTAHVVIKGSSISYKPPPGTTRVIYEFWCFFRQLDSFPIMHYAGRVAGTQVSDSRHTWRETTASGSDYQTWVYSNMTLTIGEVASDSLANGQLASWTTNKTLDFTFREYSTTYEGRLHITNHWDGGGTDILVRPVVKITAIA